MDNRTEGLRRRTACSEEDQLRTRVSQEVARLYLASTAATARNMLLRAGLRSRHSDEFDA